MSSNLPENTKKTPQKTHYNSGSSNLRKENQQEINVPTEKNVYTLQLLQQPSKKIFTYIRNLQTQCCQCVVVLFVCFFLFIVFPSFPQINHWEDYLFKLNKNKQKHTHTNNICFFRISNILSFKLKKVERVNFNFNLILKKLK